MALGVAAVFAVAFVLEFRSRANAPDKASPLFRSGLTTPAVPAPDQGLADEQAPEGSSSDGSALASHLFAPLEEDRDKAIDNFLRLLGGGDASPEGRQVSRAFTGEFRKEPALQKAYDEFRKQPATKARTREFMGRLSSMPEFRRLTARYAGAPGTGSMLRSFEGAKTLDPNRIAREWTKKATVARSDGANPPPLGGQLQAGPSAPSGGLGPARVVNLGGGGAPAAAGHDPVSAIRGAGVAAATGRAARFAGAGGMAGDGGAAAGKSSGDPGASTAAAGREAAHAVNPNLDKGFLASGRAATLYECGNDLSCNASKHIQEMLKAMDTPHLLAARRAIEAALGVNGETPTAVDLWSACFVTNNFNTCKSMCSKGASCTAQDLAETYWQACRSSENMSAYECVEECVGRWKDGCVADPGVRAVACKDRQVGCQYCAGRQYGTKVIAVPGKPPRQQTVPRMAEEVCAPIQDGPPAAAAVAGPALQPCGVGLDCSFNQNSGATLCHSASGGAGQDVYCCPTGNKILGGACVASAADALLACGTGLDCSLSNTAGATLCHSASGGAGQDVYCCPAAKRIEGGRCVGGGELPPCGAGLVCSLNPTSGATACHSASGGAGQDVYCCAPGGSISGGACVPPCGVGLECSLGRVAGGTFCHSASGGSGQNVHCCATGQRIGGGACVASGGGPLPECGVGLACSLSSTSGATLCHSASGGAGQDVYCCATGQRIRAGACVGGGGLPDCGVGLDCSLGQTAGASLCHSASGGSGQDVYCCPPGAHISGDSCIPACGSGLDCSLSPAAGATFCHSASGGAGQDVFCCAQGNRIRNGACVTALPPCGAGLDCSLSEVTGARFCHSASGGAGQDVYCCPLGKRIGDGKCVTP